MAADAGPSRRRIALARQSREKSGRLASACAAWPTFLSAGKIFRRDRTFAPRGRIETGITGGSQPAWFGLLSRGAIRPGIGEYREALRLKEAKPSAGQTASVATIRTNLANALTIVGNNLSNDAREIPAEAMRRYEEAIAQYEKGLELEPNQPGIHRNLGILLARLGRYDEAKAHLRATLQIVPNKRQLAKR